MNYYDVNFQAGLASLRKAHARGLGVVAMEPVMGGLLADALPEGAKTIFAESGIDRSLAVWSLRWGWAQPELSLLLSGMSTMEQVEENLRLAEEAETPLTCEELAVIDKVRKYLFDQFEIPCTQCNLCSCPHYIAIRDNFTIYNTTRLFNISGGINDKNYDLMLRKLTGGRPLPQLWQVRQHVSAGHRHPHSPAQGQALLRAKQRCLGRVARQKQSPFPCHVWHEKSPVSPRKPWLNGAYIFRDLCGPGQCKPISSS